MAFHLIRDEERFPMHLPDTAGDGVEAKVWYRRLPREKKRNLQRIHGKGKGEDVKAWPEKDRNLYYEEVIKYCWIECEGWVDYEGNPVSPTFEEFMRMPDDLLGQFVMVCTSSYNPFPRPEAPPVDVPDQDEEEEPEEQVVGNSGGSSQR